MASSFWPKRKETADWLNVFMRYFTTRPHTRRLSQMPTQVTMPTYHKARTFFYHDIATSMENSLYTKTTASLAKERYFKEIEKC
jgi:hypothetical protein